MVLIKKAIVSFLGDSQVRQYVKLFSTRIFGALLAVLIQILIVRLTPLDQYGIYALALSWITVLSIFPRFGMEIGINRFVPEYRATDKSYLVIPFIKFVLLFSFLFFMALICGIALVAVVSQAFLSGVADLIRQYWLIFIISAVGLMITVVIPLLLSLLRSFHVLLIPELLDQIVRPLAMAVFVISLYFVFSISPSASILMAMFSATGIFSIIILIGLILPHLKDYNLKSPILVDRALWRQWLGLGLPVLIVYGLYTFIYKIDILMLGMLATPEHVGIYNVALKIAEFTSFGFLVANSILSPHITGLYTTGQTEKLQALLTKSILLTMGLTIPSTLFLMIVSPFVLNTFGQAFEGGLIPLYILMWGQCLMAFLGPASLILCLAGFQRKVLFVLMVCSGINILLNYLLIIYLGMIGAAIGTFIFLISTNLLLAILLKKMTGLDSSFRAIRWNEIPALIGIPLVRRDGS